MILALYSNISSAVGQRPGENIFSERNNERYYDRRSRPRQPSDRDSEDVTPKNNTETSANEYQLNLTPQQRRCMALEKQLAHQWIAKSKTREILPKINEEISQLSKELRKTKSRAERADCYEDVFIFGKRIVESRKCLKFGRKIEKLERKLDHLQGQKRAVFSNDTGEEDHLVSQLARNGCGDHYVKEDRRRNPSIFSFGDDDDYNREDRDKKNQSILPFATYRTMCVRTCDGFYFPVSFSTLPSRFPQDAAACQSQCAAPAQLYVYKNPGEEIEQMISLEGFPYKEIPNAFRFRKEFVKGCSCKQAEYSPIDLGVQEAQDNQGNDGDKTPKQEKTKKIKRSELKPLDQNINKKK